MTPFLKVTGGATEPSPMVREDRWRINKADPADPTLIERKHAHTGNSARCCRQGKDVNTRRVEPTLKKGRAVNAHSGVARSAVWLYPSTEVFRHPQQRLKQLSLITVGEPVWDPLQVETRYDGLIKTTGAISACNLDGQRESTGCSQFIESSHQRW